MNLLNFAKFDNYSTYILTYKIRVTFLSKKIHENTYYKKYKYMRERDMALRSPPDQLVLYASLGQNKTRYKFYLKIYLR